MPHESGSRPTGGDGSMTPAGLRIDIVILACAVSAGIHGALVEDHFREGTGAGVGFVVATVLLAAVALTLTRTPLQFAFVAAAADLDRADRHLWARDHDRRSRPSPGRGSRRRSRTLHQGGRGASALSQLRASYDAVIHPLTQPKGTLT